MQIFYTKNNNTLMINFSNLPITKTENFYNYTLLFNDDKLVGINIFNFENTFNLTTGIIWPQNDLLNWIKSLTNIDFNSDITRHFVIVEVCDYEPIPKTHLHKCIVSDGKSKYNIICGASNVKKGLKTVLAKVDTILPNGKYITSGQVMGFQSDGMLCSYKELNLPSNKLGIIEVDNNFKVGDEFLPVYKL